MLRAKVPFLSLKMAALAGDIAASANTRAARPAHTPCETEMGHLKSRNWIGAEA